MYDLLIVGGGPGGVAAGIYAARKKMNTVLVTDSFGGQSLVSDDIQNWIGVKSVSGFELGKMLEGHLRAQESIEIVDGDLVKKIEKMPKEGFRTMTEAGKVIEAKYLLFAAGSRRKKLGIPGEEQFSGKGVAYCSTCDAPLFGGKTVAVVGGGNAGLEAVIDLFPYASKIYLLSRSGVLKGDPVTEEKVRQSSKVEIIAYADTQEILGGDFVMGLAYKDTSRDEKKMLDVQGVFVEIGAIPNSEIVKDLVTLNTEGEIVVDHKTQRTSDPGMWAIGDVADVLYKQNNISAGDGVKAVLNIYDEMRKS